MACSIQDMYSCVYYGNVRRVLAEWGDHPRTIVDSITSKAFQQEMMSSATLAASYPSNHLIVLCDAEWTDYEPVLSRTLFKEAHPILVVVAASPYDSDLLPLVNLVRANERLSLLTPQTLEVGARGFVRWDAASFRRYYCPAYNPFDPYPCAAAHTTFTSKVCPVPCPMDFFETQLNRSVTLLVVCGTIKKDVERALVPRGFKLENGAYTRRGTTVVFEIGDRKIDEVHVLEPPPILTKALFGVPTDALVVLYVAYQTPFDEPADLKAYRRTFGAYVAQTELCTTMASLEDVVAGFFVTDPCWNVQRIVAMVMRVFPEVPRNVVVEELARLVKTKRAIVDQFGTEGIVVRFLDEFFYLPRV